MKKVIGMLTLILIVLTTICAFSINSYAAKSSYILGITNIRESGGAYGVGEIKSDGTPEKKVWKIVSYSNTGSNVINYDNAFYCLKAEHGFQNNSNPDVSTIRKNYNTSFNMKTESDEVIARLNAIHDNNMTQETYNKIMWIIDHMYLPKADTASSDKDTLLLNSGITSYEVGNQLTDDDIEVVQQLALWYLTNPNNTIYHADYADNDGPDANGGPSIQTILFNGGTGLDSNYKSFSDLNRDLGEKRQFQAEDLYRYFIINADPNYEYSETATSPVTLYKNNLKAVQEGERFIVGPLKITTNGNNYQISEIEFKDQNGSAIPLTGENKLLNSSKQVVTNGNLNDIIGQDFYISLPITTSINKVSFNISGTYSGVTQATYYTTAESTFANEQPVVLIERKPENFNNSAEVTIPTPKDLDLALRKSITKINGQSPAINRLPQVSTETIPNTATYNHPKDDLRVDTNQLIEYTINVYNEGEKNGYAVEIKDYLPAGIEFIGLVGENADKYTTSVERNTNGTTTVTITNKGKTVLNKYNGGENLSSESFTIQCKVTAKAKESDQRLVNIAEITKYFDAESNVEKSKDRDSTIANFPSDLKNNSYNGNGKIENYVPGQEDDDDFEPVVIPGRYFDLSLRKFISGVNGEAISESREPEIDALSKTKLYNGEIQTAVYNHTKVPLTVKVGDIVTYTIRVYNEGQVSGYVNEITDHLPSLLEFLPEDKENLANGWYYDENDITLRTIKTNHLSKDVDKDNIIEAFDGNKLDYKEVTVRCKVKSEAVSGNKITNIAEITSFSDFEGNIVTDRDSSAKNVVLPTDEQLPDYKDDQINRGDKYIPGQEDDDDFEKIVVQIFDLALRKFITAVDNEAISNRIPVPTLNNDGNIKYNHTKEPVLVQTNNVVTYTLRIYNEGDISGYASEITDDLPQGLLYLPENDINKTYNWKMIDKDGKETDDVTKAVKVTTDYLSKEKEKTAGSNLLKAYDKELGITANNPDHKDIKIAFKVVEPNTSDRILTNIAQISDDSDELGNPIDDIDSVPGNDDMTEDDIDVEHVKLIYFDLALRKFITKVDNLDVNNRYPNLSMGEDGNIKYNHTKEPVLVANGNIVTYTIRVYNEGKMDGYAAEITDDLPQGLLYLPENEVNKTYAWKMIDKDGKETDDVTKAVKITTDYLSKEKETTANENLLKAFNKSLGITENNPDHRDVKIAFKVTEPNTSDRILINTAEISEDTNKDGKPVEDIDSIPGNGKEGEDDIDIEKVRVKYFDLALKKWVTQAIVIENGKENITNTGHTGDENPEPVVKVDLKDKKLNKVTVKFRYKIKVTNEGEIEGYVKEIKDHIPEGLMFVAQDNPDWKVVKDNVVSTAKLENTLLRPGESATVEILLTWINSDKNLGLKVNVAEISKDYNDYDDTPDIDSTPDNEKPGEDDIDDAPVILSVKTGDIQIYFTLTTIILITLAGGVYLIKKYVL